MREGPDGGVSQLVQYQTREELSFHPNEVPPARLVGTWGRRVVTLLVYLHDLVEGNKEEVTWDVYAILITISIP